MSDDRPAWARRIAAERMARDWSPLEAGEFYRLIIAATFGTVTHVLFPAPSRRDGEKEILVASGMETLEIVSRLNRSDVDNATLDALRITADRLCSEYRYMPSEQLLIERRQWLKRVVDLNSKTSRSRSIVKYAPSRAGWHSSSAASNTTPATGTQPSPPAAPPLSLVKEADHAEVAAWGREMRTWFSLTTGDYRGVIVAAQAGTELRPLMAWPCSSRRKKPRLGPASGTADRSRLLSTAVGASSKGCHTPTTSIATSWWTRRSSTPCHGLLPARR
ncbi:hypothetical protein [Streptomyces sp. 8N616]|uniref:hypothetical protein n=1 Tax=Streptomyces sp. 8N616 TaxID=3457414 RepID=UPI003FD34F48